MAPHISGHTTTIPSFTKHKTSTHQEHHHQHHSAAITLMMIMKEEGVQKQEKHIAVDPVSLKHQQESSAPNDKNININPPPLHPPKCKFLSTSQPTSPRLPSIITRINNKTTPPQPAIFHKSKSCGEGRTTLTVGPPPSDDFDLWSPIKHHHHPDEANNHFTKPESAVVKESPKRSSMRSDIIITTTNNMMDDPPPPAGRGLICSCLHIIIPGLYGKGKTVRPKKEASNSYSSTEGGGVISRTVSMDKFECGSWAPPISPPPRVVLDQVEGNDSVSSYFDLPSELIRCGGGEDAISPVVVDKYKDVRGVLKKNCSGRGMGRKSDASPRHVRFSSPSSPASPACITPRLRKARDEFNAFLQAHSTTA